MCGGDEQDRWRPVMAGIERDNQRVMCKILYEELLTHHYYLLHVALLTPLEARGK